MKRKVKITGDCFDSAFDMFMADKSGRVVLVHGLPIGRGGDAAKVGTYPHAWIEFPDINMVHDTVANVTIDKDRFYELGQIEFTKRYSDKATIYRLLAKYGRNTRVWSRTIKHRAKKISKMRI